MQPEKVVVEIPVHEFSLQVCHGLNRAQTHSHVLQVVNVGVESGDRNRELARGVHVIVDDFRGCMLLLALRLFLTCCRRVRYLLRSVHLEVEKLFFCSLGYFRAATLETNTQELTDLFLKQASITVCCYVR